MLLVGHGHVGHVAERSNSVAAALVEVARLDPVALVVRLDAEVVEHVAWPLRSPSSSEIGSASPRYAAALGRAEHRVHEVEQQVRGGEVSSCRRSAAPRGRLLAAL